MELVELGLFSLVLFCSMGLVLLGWCDGWGYCSNLLRLFGLLVFVV